MDEDTAVLDQSMKQTSLENEEPWASEKKDLEEKRQMLEGDVAHSTERLKTLTLENKTQRTDTEENMFKLSIGESDLKSEIQNKHTDLQTKDDDMEERTNDYSSNISQCKQDILEARNKLLSHQVNKKQDTDCRMFFEKKILLEDIKQLEGKEQILKKRITFEEGDSEDLKKKHSGHPQEMDKATSSDAAKIRDYLDFSLRNIDGRKNFYEASHEEEVEMLVEAKERIDQLQLTIQHSFSTDCYWFQIKENLKAENEALKKSKAEEIDKLNREMTAQRNDWEAWKEQYRVTESEQKAEIDSLKKNLEKAQSGAISTKDDQPGLVVQEYDELMKIHWKKAADALELLCKQEGEKSQLKALSDMLMICARKAEAALTDFMKNFAKMIMEPIQSAFGQENRKVDTGDVTDTDIEKCLAAETEGLYTLLRVQKKHINVAPLVKAVEKKLLENKEGLLKKDVLENVDVHAYLVACCRLTWRMAIQQPPLKFDAPNIGRMLSMGDFGDEVYQTCSKSRLHFVDFYVKFPIKRDGFDQIVKGVMYTCRV